MNAEYLVGRNECVKDMMAHGYSKEEAEKILDKDRTIMSTREIKEIIKKTFELVTGKTAEDNRYFFDSDRDHLYGTLTFLLWAREQINICGRVNITYKQYEVAIKYLNELLPESKEIADYDVIKVEE